MLNLTRRERNVIKTLVLLYIAGCIVFYGKKNYQNSNASSEKDSVVADFQERVEKVDSIFFANDDLHKNVEIDQKININTANAITLQKIKGIGPVTAMKIVEYRSENGNFNTLEELKNVNGIGDKTLEKIKGEVTIE